MENKILISVPRFSNALVEYRSLPVAGFAAHIATFGSESVN